MGRISLKAGEAEARKDAALWQSIIDGDIEVTEHTWLPPLSGAPAGNHYSRSLSFSSHAKSHELEGSRLIHLTSSGTCCELGFQTGPLAFRIGLFCVYVHMA